MALGDFDALFVNLPDQDGAFLLPASKLAMKGILKTDEYAGKTWVSCYKPGWECSRDIDIDNWSQDYYIDYDSAQAQDRFKEILEECRVTS